MTKARDLANASTALSAVSATELAFVDGVTSAIQTQLDAKATLTGTETFTNKTLTSPVLTTPTISTVNAKGDLLAGTADNTVDRLAVGNNGESLVADSAQATGLRYRSAAYSAKTAAYTFVSGDDGKIFSMNAATSVQFNIPTDATFDFAVGTEINVFWITGAGQPTIGAVTPGTTTVISTGATSATPKLRVANSGATCKKLAANSWIVFGDIA